MGEIGDALGTVATGGLVARALEPGAGEAAAHGGGHTHENACLNCGTPLAGPHCHSCGQRAHVHRSLRGFAHDLLHGVLHFEGKTWRTLPLLVWRPGKLTREYIDGKRASYVSPIALFLFVVFLSFAVFNIIGGNEMFVGPERGIEAAKVEYKDNAERLAALRKQQAGLGRDDGARRNILNNQIKTLEEEQQGLEIVLGDGGGAIRGDVEEGFAENPLPPDSTLAKAIEEVRANPQLAIYKAQTNAYKYSWALIPLSVPFIWLLFPFSRRFGAYDHTVFATYSISFMIALAAVVSLLFYAGWDTFGALLLLFAPWHMYRQLRGTYALGRFGALWRMLLLSLFAWVVIALFISVIGLVTA